MTKLEQALSSQIGQINGEDLLLKALHYLILYHQSALVHRKPQIQHKLEKKNKKEEKYGKENNEKKEKIEYPLRDTYSDRFRVKKPIPKLIPYVS